MNDWDGSSDQYHVDVETRYPLFSDIQTNDYSTTIAPYKPWPLHATSYESKFQAEQQRLPTYYACKCGSCQPMKDYWPEPKQPLRRQTLDERLKRYQEERDSMFLHGGDVSATNITPFDRADINGGVFVIIFMFLVIVFICCFYTKSISELKSQLETLKQMVKNN